MTCTHTHTHIRTHKHSHFDDVDADVTGLVTSTVVDLLEMMQSATSFSGIGVNTWNVSNVSVMNGVFSGCSAFNGDLSQVQNCRKVAQQLSFCLTTPVVA